MGGPIILGILILALIGSNAINLGVQGFAASGMDVGFGLALRGKTAKVVGAVIALFGAALVFPLFWLVTRIVIDMVKTPAG